IRKLEDIVGAQLFDRTTRKVALSPVGAELLDVTVNLFQDFESALAHLRDYVEGKRGRLTIAAAPSLAAVFLPEIIASFERDNARITIQVHDALAEAAIELVRTGKADLAIAPERFEDKELTHRELFRDDLVLLCRVDHPLARRRVVKWRELQSFRLV